MNRASGTNGHTAEPVQARGGYDAFFTPVLEPPAADGSGASASDTVRGPTDAASVSGNGAATATNGPGTPAAAASMAENAATSPPVASHTATEGAGAVAHPSAPEAPAAAATPSPDAQPGPTATASGPAVPTPGATAPAPAPTVRTPGAAVPMPGSTAATTGAAAPPPGPAPTAAGPSAFGSTGSGTAGAGFTGAAGTTWNAGHAATPTAWRPDASPSAGGTTPAASAAARVPDRVDHAASRPADRVEVLPAELTSAELLADIAAARRAQLKSTSGMRGALNKVGFNLGLSPAEQRKQNRRGRIRRQLNSTYQIAVISVKGGVGRTTVTATLGSTFARLRPDRVVAIDANPDFGDLPTRTSHHPYGLTLRDLVQSPNLEAFSAVHSYTSINDADLAVLASPWSTEAVEPLSGREYTAAVGILRRHYNLMVADCGTGVLDSATGSVLQTSDAVVVVTQATVGGVKGAVATLNWMNSHGLSRLISKSVVAIVQQHPSKPTVEIEQIEKLFATAQRPTFVLPYDAHLAEGGEIDLRLVDEETGVIFEELAAALADGFPGASAAGMAERGEWR